MRVVVDTGILVRALIKPRGSVGPVLQHLRDGAYTLLYAESSLQELVDVLGRPRIRHKYHLTDEDVRTVLTMLFVRGQEVWPNRAITACRDPRDNQFLEIAIAGQADVIVSGDDDLLVLNTFEGVPIVSPATFLAMLAGNQQK